jgi:alpha-L-fucosidase 2
VSRTHIYGLPLRRRAFLAATTAGLATLGSANARIKSPARVKTGRKAMLKLWYEKPALRWVEALPLGNGRLAAMVYGRVKQERIQLNEGTLWAGSPYDPNHPDALQALPIVRRLIDEEKYQEAADLVSKSVMARPLSQMPYGAAGDLFLTFHGLEAPKAYRRSLDLNTAVARTTFRVRGGAILQEVFVSEPDQVIVVHLAAHGTARLNFDIGYRHPDATTYGAEIYNGENAAVTAADASGASWDFEESLKRDNRPADLSVAEDGPAALLIKGRNVASAGVPAGLTYAVRACARSDGLVAVNGDVMAFRSARSVTLVIAAATSFVSPVKIDGNPVAKVRLQTSSSIRKKFAELKHAHIAAHDGLFGRFAMSIGTPGPADKAPTINRILQSEQDTGGLATLYVQYARYLMLGCSRGSGQAANLQGIWNEGTNPPWGCKYTININTEMNYWPVNALNLGECVEPLVRLVEELSITGARTARAMYGAGGWVAHHNTDLWRASAPIDGPLWGIWPMGGAWLCKALWDHYEYSGDRAFLHRIYPLIKGACLFFFDTLVEDPKGRGLITSPSLSPEHEHHPGVSICAGPAMDRQILRDLFGIALAAHRLVSDSDTEFAATAADKRERLAKDRIGAQGQLQEWLEDWDATAPEQQHRHVSHLYAVYPSDQINVRDTPELIAAAKVSLNTRGDLSTGWATAWRLALWARMGEGERAHGILQGLLGPSRTYPNLFDAHPPFQIDGNFGGTAGILEMIVQSWGGEVRVLPALPSAWPDGSIDGLRVRGGVELHIAWKAHELQKLTFKGPAFAEIPVRYRDTLRIVHLDALGRASWM